MTKPFSRVLQGGPTRAPSVAMREALGSEREMRWFGGTEKICSKPKVSAKEAAAGEATIGILGLIEAISRRVGGWAWSGRL